MSPTRYLPDARAVDNTRSTPTASAIPSPTSSSSDPFASAPPPYIPNWIPIAVLILFRCGILGMVYWAYKSSAGKFPSSKNIFKEGIAAQSAHPKLGARGQSQKSQLKATISRPTSAHTAAPGPGSVAARAPHCPNAAANGCALASQFRRVLVERPLYWKENSASTMPAEDSGQRDGRMQRLAYCRATHPYLARRVVFEAHYLFTRNGRSRMFRRARFTLPEAFEPMSEKSGWLTAQVRQRAGESEGTHRRELFFMFRGTTTWPQFNERVVLCRSEKILHLLRLEVVYAMVLVPLGLNSPDAD
ncbi:hypothetical protein DFH09DRAFT_1095547 [Mycena vulgaris]|nr:hypothetical protein DFH09DRAFT_1095547 [Mycena vulgaris]